VEYGKIFTFKCESRFLKLTYFDFQRKKTKGPIDAPCGCVPDVFRCRDHQRLFNTGELLKQVGNQQFHPSTAAESNDSPGQGSGKSGDSGPEAASGVTGNSVLGGDSNDKGGDIRG
jgi:hypothetical protein